MPTVAAPRLPPRPLRRSRPLCLRSAQGPSPPPPCSSRQDLQSLLRSRALRVRDIVKNAPLPSPTHPVGTCGRARARTVIQLLTITHRYRCSHRHARPPRSAASRASSSAARARSAASVRFCDWYLRPQRRTCCGLGARRTRRSNSNSRGNQGCARIAERAPRTAPVAASRALKALRHATRPSPHTAINHPRARQQQKRKHAPDSRRNGIMRGIRSSSSTVGRRSGCRRT